MDRHFVHPWIRSARVSLALTLCAASSWTAGCSDSITEPPAEVPAGRALVSDPVVPQSADSGLAAAARPMSGVVFVSLAPGAVDAGTELSVQNRTTGFSTTVPLVDGGSDPVAVPAAGGDTLDLAVREGAVAAETWIEVVELRRPPVVVRTHPPKGRRDVPINAQLRVVFTEPIDPASISDGAISLLRDGTATSATVHLDVEGLVAEIVPESPLEPGTVYEISVTESVQDRSGDALESPVRADFTTGSGGQSEVALILITPVRATVAIPQLSMGQAGLPLTATAYDAAGHELSGHEASWSTLHPNVATVDTTGYVTGVGRGEAVIQAAVGDVVGESRISVVDLVIRLADSGTSWSVRLGDTLRLVSEAHGANGRVPVGVDAVGWYTDGDSILGLVVTGPESVSVVGRRVGAARIHVSYPWGSRSAWISVTTGAPVSAITVAPDTVRAAPNQQPPVTRFNLRATLFDSNGDTTYAASAGAVGWEISPTPDGTKVRWDFDSPDVAHVEIGGGPGEYTVTSSYDGSTARTTVLIDYVTLASVSTGYQRQCFLTPEGAAYCGGNNGYGAIGYGSAFYEGVDGPIAVAGGHTFETIANGYAHVCALTPEGIAYCWGWNDLGQLGDGTTADRSSPVTVRGGLTFASIATGLRATCALTVAGEPYCWGGYGYTNFDPPVREPARVPTDHRFEQLSMNGGSHACGLTAGGEAYCWGWNRYGSLGDGTTESSSTPVRVVGDLAFTRIAAGAEHTCAATAEGEAYCWGWGASLADGPAVTAPTRIELPEGVQLVEISAGQRLNCGLTAAGEAYCWGFTYSWYDPADETLPPRRMGDLLFTSIAAGWGEACGVTAGPVAYCWQEGGLTISEPGRVGGQR